MTLDVNEVQQQAERIPWLRQVTVRKQWPDELKIHLVEYVPYARWNDSQMVDDAGQVFSLPAELTEKDSFPMLYGAQGSEQDVLSGYREMAQQAQRGRAENQISLNVTASCLAAGAG